MAFTPAPKATETTTATANGKRDTPRTTIGYVNHYIRLKDGTRIKMHADLQLRLYAEKPADVKLIELLKSGQLESKQVNGIFEMEFGLARDENAPIEFDM